VGTLRSFSASTSSTGRREVSNALKNVEGYGMLLSRVSYSPLNVEGYYASVSRLLRAISRFVLLASRSRSRRHAVKGGVRCSYPCQPANACSGPPKPLPDISTQDASCMYGRGGCAPAWPWKWLCSRILSCVPVDCLLLQDCLAAGLWRLSCCRIVVPSLLCLARRELFSALS